MMDGSTGLPNDPAYAKRYRLNSVFNRSMGVFSNYFLAPVIIVTYAHDLQEAIDFVVANPLLTGGSIAIFSAILLYNIFLCLRSLPQDAILGSETRVLENNFPAIEAYPHTPAPDQKIHRLARWRLPIRSVAIGSSLLAFVALAYIYFLVFVSGLHYVVIASAANEESAVREIQSLNRAFEDINRRDLRARAYASTATGTGWYMISIGGPHFSQEAAQKTFAAAKIALGERFRPDSFIYSTKNASPTRILRNRIRDAYRWLTG